MLPALCSEEGLFYADDLDPDQLEVLKNYARTELAGSEIKAFPPKLKLALYSRSMFLKKAFWKAVQRGIPRTYGHVLYLYKNIRKPNLSLPMEVLARAPRADCCSDLP